MNFRKQLSLTDRSAVLDYLDREWALQAIRETAAKSYNEAAERVFVARDNQAAAQRLLEASRRHRQATAELVRQHLELGPVPDRAGEAYFLRAESYRASEDWAVAQTAAAEAMAGGRRPDVRHVEATRARLRVSERRAQEAEDRLLRLAKPTPEEVRQLLRQTVSELSGAESPGAGFEGAQHYQGRSQSAVLLGLERPEALPPERTPAVDLAPAPNDAAILRQALHAGQSEDPLAPIAGPAVPASVAEVETTHELAGTPVHTGLPALVPPALHLTTQRLLTPVVTRGSASGAEVLTNEKPTVGDTASNRAADSPPAAPVAAPHAAIAMRIDQALYGLQGAHLTIHHAGGLARVPVRVTVVAGRDGESAAHNTRLDLVLPGRVNDWFPSPESNETVVAIVNRLIEWYRVAAVRPDMRRIDERDIRDLDLAESLQGEFTSLVGSAAGQPTVTAEPVDAALVVMMRSYVESGNEPPAFYSFCLDAMDELESGDLQSAMMLAGAGIENFVSDPSHTFGASLESCDGSASTMAEALAGLEQAPGANGQSPRVAELAEVVSRIQDYAFHSDVETLERPWVADTIDALRQLCGPLGPGIAPSEAGTLAIAG